MLAGFFKSIACLLKPLRRSCTALKAKVRKSPTAAIVRCPAGPVRPVFVNARLLVTFKALCAVADITAAAKPTASKVGELHEAAAIPTAIGTKDIKAATFGSDDAPSNRRVSKTVISGMPHFEV